MAALLPGKNSRYQLDRRLGGPQSRFGSCGKEKHPALAENPTLIYRLFNLSLYRLSCADRRIIVKWMFRKKILKFVNWTKVAQDMVSE
jgi:hypothetical protein